MRHHTPTRSWYLLVLPGAPNTWFARSLLSSKPGALVRDKCCCSNGRQCSLYDLRTSRACATRSQTLLAELFGYDVDSKSKEVDGMAVRATVVYSPFGILPACIKRIRKKRKNTTQQQVCCIIPVRVMWCSIGS